MTTIKAGETKRIECEVCASEFDVTYEPKANNDPESRGHIPDGEVSFCPSCGSDVNGVDDDDS